MLKRCCIVLLVPNFLLFAGCADVKAPAPWYPDGSHVRRLVDSLANLHMRPMDRWIEAGTGYERFPTDEEVHYALVIRPEDKRAPLLCYRMTLHYERDHRPAIHSQKAEEIVLEEGVVQYAARCVGAVRAALKSDLIDAYMKNDPERIETLTFGASFFCRMPTEHSDPAKVRPEDVVERR